MIVLMFFFFKQKTAYEMRISDWSSDVCTSDLPLFRKLFGSAARLREAGRGLWMDRNPDRGPAGTGRGHPADAGHPRPGDGGLPGDEGRKLLSHDPVGRELGRASCRERWCQYV